jgi:hypothetical protein
MFLRMQMRSSGSHFTQSWQECLHTPFSPSMTVGSLSHLPAATRALVSRGGRNAAANRQAGRQQEAVKITLQVCNVTALQQQPWSKQSARTQGQLGITRQVDITNATAPSNKLKPGLYWQTAATSGIRSHCFNTFLCTTHSQSSAVSLQLAACSSALKLPPYGLLWIHLVAVHLVPWAAANMHVLHCCDNSLPSRPCYIE